MIPFQAAPPLFGDEDYKYQPVGEHLYKSRLYKSGSSNTVAFNPPGAQAIILDAKRTFSKPLRSMGDPQPAVRFTISCPSYRTPILYYSSSLYAHCSESKRLISTSGQIQEYLTGTVYLLSTLTHKQRSWRKDSSLTTAL